MGVASFFKGIFGSKKVDEIIDQAGNFADDAIAKAKQSAAPLIDKVEDFAEQAGDKIKEYVPQATATIDNAVETVKEKASDLIEKVEDMAHGAVGTAQEKATNLAADTTEKTADKVAE
ncbi:hypothetical protein VT569_05425 [Flavobacterium psychrophilum]|uniref:hypothetical protein n=1 Tax=Flavobacterium psychrophilum TaxID=96345 RepID=UPI003B435093